MTGEGPVRTVAVLGTGHMGSAMSRALAAGGFDGNVVIEVNTRRAMSSAEREADLAEALAFTRLHLASSAGTPRS